MPRVDRRSTLLTQAKRRNFSAAAWSRLTVAPAGYATRDLPLLKSINVATVEPTPLAIL